MLRRIVLLAMLVGTAVWLTQGTLRAQATDWEKFYYYPYIYYPHNFWSQQYYRGSNSLYYRYPPELRIPVYNKDWYNFYPEDRKYHRGHHFILDVF
ncbi:MAG: calmodulin-binding protein [Pirellulales bacterium]